MTAYRQQALACAGALRSGPARPRDLREVAPDAGRILLRNVYGWLERTGRGVYRLRPLAPRLLIDWDYTGIVGLQVVELTDARIDDKPSRGRRRVC